MMLTPTYEVLVGGRRLGAVKKLKVLKSRQETANAKIELPLHPDYDLGTFSLGEPVTVEMGYREFVTAQVFSGEVTDLSVKQPLVVTAGDGLKLYEEKGAYTKPYAGVGWADVVAELAEMMGLELFILGDISHLGVASMRVDGQTPLQVMERVREQTGWLYWQEGETLYFAMPNLTISAPLWRYEVGVNIIKCDLEYRSGPIVGQVVVYFSDPDFKGPPATARYPDPAEDGKRVTIRVVDGGDADAALERARQEYFRRNSFGYSGNFTTFCNPQLVPGQEIYIYDEDHSKRSGHYTVETVEFTWALNQGLLAKVWVASTPP